MAILIISDVVIVIAIVQFCMFLGMWTMYWMRKEYKVSKLTKNRRVTGCCWLQKVMLTYGEHDEEVV